MDTPEVTRFGVQHRTVIELPHGNAPHSIHTRLTHQHLDHIAHRVAHACPRCCDTRRRCGHYPDLALAKATLVFVLSLAAILGALRRSLGSCAATMGIGVKLEYNAPTDCLKSP